MRPNFLLDLHMLGDDRPNRQVLELLSERGQTGARRVMIRFVHNAESL